MVSRDRQVKLIDALVEFSYVDVSTAREFVTYMGLPKLSFALHSRGEADFDDDRTRRHSKIIYRVCVGELLSEIARKKVRGYVSPFSAEDYTPTTLSQRSIREEKTRASEAIKKAFQVHSS